MSRRRKRRSPEQIVQRLRDAAGLRRAHGREHTGMPLAQTTLSGRCHARTRANPFPPRGQRRGSSGSDSLASLMLCITKYLYA
jgi:hypothetical protein